MNKTDLIGHVASAAGLTKAQATLAVDATIAAITKTLKQGDEVAIVGFGTFSVTDRPERAGRNPRTGEPTTIPATKAPKFRPGKTLKEAVAS